jgi:hypothetical protein
MDIIIFIIKIISGLLAGGIATIIINEKSKDESKKNERKKKIDINKIAIYSIIAIWISFGTSSMLDLISVINNRKKEMANEIKSRKNEELSRTILLNTIRPSFQLEPLTIEYEVEYKINEDIFTDYIKRIKPILIDYFNEPLDSINAEINLSVENKNWMPIKGEEAYNVFSEDDVTFFIRKKSSSELRYYSYSNSLSDNLVHKKTNYKYNQEIIHVGAYFKGGIIRKVVRVENPLRDGSDNLSFSALDLVGKHINYDYGYALNKLYNYKRNIVWMKFIFPFQTGEPERIDFSDFNNIDSVFIDYKNVGLGKIEDMLKK